MSDKDFELEELEKYFSGESGGVLAGPDFSELFQDESTLSIDSVTQFIEQQKTETGDRHRDLINLQSLLDQARNQFESKKLFLSTQQSLIGRVEESEPVVKYSTIINHLNTWLDKVNEEIEQLEQTQQELNASLAFRLGLTKVGEAATVLAQADDKSDIHSTDRGSWQESVSSRSQTENKKSGCCVVM